MKIPLLNEIHPFDNSVKVYRSISGHTFENWSSEKPVCSVNSLNCTFSDFFFSQRHGRLQCKLVFRLNESALSNQTSKGHS